MHTRPATLGDLADLRRLHALLQTHHAAADPHWFKSPTDGETGPNTFAELMARRDNHFILAEAGEPPRPIGYAWVEVVDQAETPLRRPHRSAYLHHLIVEPAARRGGAGGALMAAFRDVGARAGADRLILNVWEFNAAARNFFRAQGFEPLQTRLWAPLAAADGLIS